MSGALEHGPATRPSAGTERQPGALRSALYEGRLWHHRSGPGVAHNFSYGVTLPLLDLDETGAVFAIHPLLSDRRPAPVWFRRSDFLGPSTRPLADCVRDLVGARTGERPAGPVAMLAHVRTWGWLFNPITLYFCYDEEGRRVEAMVAEVENTPWHQRCNYVVGPPGQHRFAKLMHVSPFQPMDVSYVLRYSQPGEHLMVQMDVVRGQEMLFSAGLSLRRRPIDRRALGRLVWSPSALAHLVSAGIYLQAGKLRRMGAPFFAHPSKARPWGKSS